MRRVVMRAGAAALLLGSAVTGVGVGVDVHAAGAAPGLTVEQSPNGPSVKLTFTAGAQTGLVTFTGLVGENVRVITSGGTFAANCDLQVTLLKVNGTALSGPVCGGKHGTIPTITLPRDGTYTVRAVAGAAATGAVKFAVKSTGPIASITPQARPIALAVTSTTQDSRFGFVATAGAVFTVNVTDANLPGCSAFRIAILKPNTSVLKSIDACGAGGLLDQTVIPADGVYRVQMLNLGGGTGSVGLALYGIDDQTGTAKLDGTPNAVKITRPGQNARFTFNGTAGQGVSVAATESTFEGCDALSMHLIRPNGSQLTETGTCSSTALLDAELDRTGKWTVLFDPAGPSTGTAVLAAYHAVDLKGPIKLDGTPVNYSSSLPGQKAHFTFAGTSGRRVSVNATGATFPGCNGWELRLLRPDDSVFSEASSCGATAFLDAGTLDVDGTWIVEVDPDGSATGSVSVQAYAVVDQTRAITLGGAAMNFSTSVPGANLRATFSGASGQSVSVNATGGTFVGCDAYTLWLLRPDESVFAIAATCGADAFLDAQALDMAGTWTVLLDPTGAATGSVSVRAFTVVDQTGAIVVGGATKSVSSSVPGKNARFKFSGTSGDSRTVTVNSSTFPGCPALHVSLLRPDGSTLSVNAACASGGVFGPAVLDATGTWTLLFDPEGPATGSATVALS